MQVLHVGRYESPYMQYTYLLANVLVSTASLLVHGARLQYNTEYCNTNQQIISGS